MLAICVNLIDTRLRFVFQPSNQCRRYSCVKFLWGSLHPIIMSAPVLALGLDSKSLKHASKATMI